MPPSASIRALACASRLSRTRRNFSISAASCFFVFVAKISSAVGSTGFFSRGAIIAFKSSSSSESSSLSLFGGNSPAAGRRGPSSSDSSSDSSSSSDPLTSSSESSSSSDELSSRSLRHCYRRQHAHIHRQSVETTTTTSDTSIAVSLVAHRARTSCAYLCALARSLIVVTAPSASAATALGGLIPASHVACTKVPTRAPQRRALFLPCARSTMRSDAR